MIDTIKDRARRRSRIIQGQMRGLEKMIESDVYCADILTQSLAIQRSLRSLNKLLLENHLQTCVNEKFNQNSQTAKRQVVKELLDLYEFNNVRGK